MSIVSTIMPSSANFCFPAVPSQNASSPVRPRPSRVYSPPSALSEIEAGPLISTEGSSNTLTVPVTTPPIPSGSSVKSPGRPGHHSHRRSAAVSHDFNASPLFTSTSPKNSPPVGSVSPPSSHPYNRSPTLTFASSSLSLPQESYTFSASASSLPLEETGINTNCPKKKKLPKVSFATEPENIPRSPQKDDDDKSDSTCYDSTSDLTRSITSPGMIKVSTSGSISSTSSSNNSKGVSKSKSRRLRHKKVKSWAGNLIRFGSKKDNKREHSQHEDNCPSLGMDVDDDATPEVLLQSSSFIPTILFDNSSINFSTFGVASPEPKIDLDAALGPFQTPSLSTDSEFGSHHYFHRRSESAPEMTLGPAFRGMKRKMGPVVEEEPEEEQLEVRNEEESTTAAMSNVSISPIKPIAGLRRPSSPSRYLAARGYKSNTIGTAPIVSNSQSKSPDMNSVFSNSTTSVNSLDNHKEQPTTPDNNTTTPAEIIRVVNQLSEIDDVPTVSSLHGVQNGLDLGEPGPEIRCSIDSVSVRMNQGFSPHPSTSSLSHGGQNISGQNRGNSRLNALIGRRTSQDTASFNGSLNSNTKRNPASRVWGWIRGKKNSS